MDKPRISFVNRLQERGLVDQWGFALFAAAGAVGIVAAKWFEAPALWVAAGAVIVMLAYAALISRCGSGRLRSDQAGDNCYYLGLIYTLASLAYAIVTFDPANTATTIVQGFGIALATTIVGLVLRVVFNQGRPDLEEVESGARRDLLEAVALLKTELGQAVVSMNDFGRQVRQSISETREAATSDITNFAETAVGGLQEVMSAAKDALQSEAADFALRTKRHGAAVDRLVSTLEAHGANLDRLATAHEQVAGTLESIAAAGAEAREATRGLVEQAEAASSVLATVRESSDSVRQSSDALGRAASDVRDSVASFGEEISEQLRSLREAPGAAVAEATDALARSSAAMRGELESLTAAQRNAATSISEQAATATEAVRRHNSAMEAELGRSRDLVEKVHANLVDMTSELVRRIDGQQ
jgi:hypothetical protein